MVLETENKNENGEEKEPETEARSTARIHPGTESHCKHCPVERGEGLSAGSACVLSANVGSEAVRM